MTEHNTPWVYRPREFDDWGWIRDATGNLAACARGNDGSKSHDQHRADKTDPYGEYAARIVTAVNAHEGLVAALEQCAAPYSTMPGSVQQCQAQVDREFQRRMDIAGAALASVAQRQARESAQ